VNELSFVFDDEGLVKEIRHGGTGHFTIRTRRNRGRVAYRRGEDGDVVFVLLPSTPFNELVVEEVPQAQS
jgi:hypothetical protein